MKANGYYLKILIVINIMLLIFNLTWIGIGTVKKQDQEPKTSNQYPYLSKRIFSESQNDLIINFTILRSAIREYVAKNTDEESGKDIGVYFEYLPTGTSIGVNDQLEEKLASLIKIPVVMAAYKAVDEGKLSLDQELIITDGDLDPSFGELWKRGKGTKISVRQAIDLAIIESDNTATKTLTHALPEGYIDDIFDSLDVPKNKNQGFTVISPKNYTSILRSLYLSSYLNRDHSNEILDILSRTNFNDRIPVGVPNHIKVSHKIGIYNLNNASPNNQPVFSDCGIVYANNRPYSLCIMTKNVDESISKRHMQIISKMVYGYIEKI